MTTTTDHYRLKVSQEGAEATERSMKRLSKSITNVAVALVGTHGVYRATRAVISAYMEQEKAVRRLSAVAGPYTEILRKQAAAYQRVTVHGDEAIMQVQRLVIQLGAKTAKEVDRATKATLELATALDMDLNSAARLVGQAMSGNVQTLARYIPEVRKLTKEQIDQGAALDLVIKRLGGSAAAEADTLYGSMMQAKNAAGDLLEVIGAETGLAAMFKQAAINVKDLSMELQHLSKSDLWQMASDIAGAIGFSELSRELGIESRAAKLKGYRARQREQEKQAALITGTGSFPGSGSAAGGASIGGKIAKQFVDELPKLLKGEGGRSAAQSILESRFGTFAETEQVNWMTLDESDVLQHLDALDKMREAERAYYEERKLLTEQNMRLLEQAATGMSSLMGQTMAYMLADQENQGKKFLQGILSLLGTLAIARGNVVVADALAEEYMSYGASLRAMAPGQALIA